MEAGGILLLIVLAGYFLAGPAFGIAAWRSLRRRDTRIESLTARLYQVEVQLAALGERERPAAAAATAPKAPEAAAADVSAEAALRWAAPPFQPPEDVADADQTPIFVPQSDDAKPGNPLPIPASLEESLSSRWMLWLGAVTLSLGGAFLVKYAIDEGWIGPALRVSLGFALGLGLTGWGEWLRRRPLQQAIAALRPNYLPLSLGAAGVWIAFASVYAAFELYNLISPLVAFTLLGCISVGAVFLALLQGPFMALLGVIGGYATPMLVPSQHPSAWGLLTYVLFIAASGLAIVRFTGAWWVAGASLLGAVGWEVLWAGAFWQTGDAVPTGAFLLGLMLLTALVPQRGMLRGAGQQLDIMLESLGEPASLAIWAMALITALLDFVLLLNDGYAMASLATLVLLTLLYGWLAWRAPRFTWLAVLAAALVVLAFTAWHVLPPLVPDFSLGRALPPQTERMPQAYAPQAMVPPDAATFLWTATFFAALAAIGGFAALWLAPLPAIWASVSAATPVLLLVVAFWRIDGFRVNFSWALVSLLMACLACAAAWRLQPRRAEHGFAVGLAAYAAASVACLSLGASMTVHQAWLTVALSVELPALAWIGHRLGVRELRPVAAVLACVVLCRLLLNISILDYPMGSLPLLNWVLYGYGLPALAFFAAARWFARSGAGRVVLLLDAGAMAFAVLLVGFQIHLLHEGDLATVHAGLQEMTIHTAVWLAAGIGLGQVAGRTGNPVALWGGRVLAGAAVAQVLLGHLMVWNPLTETAADVGRLPVLNSLLLLYALPALLVAHYVRQERLAGNLARSAWTLVLLLVFVNLSLEVRHVYHGGLLALGQTGDAEWYAYSAAWLLFAGLLLALGIRQGSVGLRYASLAVLLLTVLKVFLSDMADLRGLYRVGSFIGLGLCLIGVGYLYQRFVFPPKARQG